MNAIRKIATTLGCVTLAVSGVFFAAPTAQADWNDCMSFLQRQGHPYNGYMDWACWYGEKNDWYKCLGLLERQVPVFDPRF